MASAALPAALPGRFFVVEYDRDGERFRLYTDDKDKSSYLLPEDVQAVMRQFDLWGYKDIGCRAYDIAREFGACQAIPGDDRTIPLFDRRTRGMTRKLFEERPKHVTLPRL